MSSHPIEILLVEDNPGDARFVREMVRETPELHLQHVDRLAAGLDHLGRHKVDVVLLDLGLPDSQGLDTLRTITRANPIVPVVVLTGHDDEALGRAAVHEGAQDYLVKGRVVEHALTRAVRYAVERGEAQARLRHLNRVLRAIRGVDQLIVHEKDPARLIQEACDLLVETREYRAVWIAQGGETGPPSRLAQAGWGDDFEPFAERLRRGDLPPCWDQARAGGRELVVLEPGTDCPGCPLQAAHGHELTVVAPLRHGSELHGMLGVCLALGTSVDEDERSLLVEMAGDLGLALHGIARDLAQRRGQEQQRLALEVLAALNRTNDITMLIGDILHLIKGSTGVEAVAIRLREGDDFPYFVTNGFAGGFVEAERHLCARDEGGRTIVDSEGQPVLECMCGNVIRGRFDPSKPFFTKGGSFWTNCTTELLASTAEEDRQARTRNRCNGEGYESVALIPLRSGTETIGLLQLNDHHTGMFTLETIEFFEGLSASIGIALARRRTTEALEHERHTAQCYLDIAGVMIVAIAPNKNVLLANKKACEILGCEDSDLIGNNWFDVALPEESRDRIRAGFDDLLAGNTAQWEYVENPVLPRRGEERLIAWHNSVLRDETGRAIATLSSGEDITERRRAEEKLRQSEERFRILFEQAADSILLLEITPESIPIIRDANSATFRLLGYQRDELIGQPASFIDAAPGASKAAGERRHEFLPAMGGVIQMAHRCKDGTIRDLECSVTEIQIGSRTYAISVERDITERQQAEAERKKLLAQLIQAQKMESVGRLAGGVAHDFNNLLQAVLSTTQVARLLAPEGRVAKTLEEIEAHARRGAALTRQLLLFSRRQPAQREPLDLAALVAEETVMLRRLLPENIALAVETSGEALPLLADAGQLSQVLANLAVNARDAMPDGGRLEIRTLRRNSAVVLEVKDTGAGMTAEVQEHLFEPFFTTKGVGKGTGLGLAVVFGIVSEHGGRIEVESTPGQGSCFRVVLPASQGQASAAQAQAEEDTVPPGRGERVLLVEDEAGARASLAELLELLGYHVTAAGSGEEAGLLPRDPGFDLLLTDLMLPGITGVEMASGLVERWPHLAVVVMSGYTADVLDRHQVDSGAMHFLQKPFDLQALARMLREALDRRPEAEGT